MVADYWILFLVNRWGDIKAVRKVSAFSVWDTLDWGVKPVVPHLHRSACCFLPKEANSKLLRWFHHRHSGNILHSLMQSILLWYLQSILQVWVKSGHLSHVLSHMETDWEGIYWPIHMSVESLPFCPVCLLPIGSLGGTSSSSLSTHLFSHQSHLTELQLLWYRIKRWESHNNTLQ